MHNVTRSPSLAPGIQPPVGMLRLAANDAPEHVRPDLLREFFQRLGVRYDVMATGREPIAIDLTLRRLPGLQLSSGTLRGARYLRTRETTDPAQYFPRQTSQPGVATNTVSFWSHSHLRPPWPASLSP